MSERALCKSAKRCRFFGGIVRGEFYMWGGTQDYTCEFYGNVWLVHIDVGSQHQQPKQRTLMKGRGDIANYNRQLA